MDLLWGGAAIVEVLVLGPVRARLDGRDVPIRGGRERAFLAALALAGPAGIDTHRLSDLVWGEGAPPTALRTAAAHVSRLRAALGAGTIVTEAGRHRLEGVEVDLWRFEALRERAVAAPAEARAALTAALALWRDPTPAADASLDGATARIASLVRTRLNTAEQLLAYVDDASAVDLAEEILSEDPFRENVWLALAEALDRLGRPAEALHALRRARRELVEELGLDPSPAMRTLEAELLNRGSSGYEPAPLGHPAGDGAPGPSGAGAGAASRQHAPGPRGADRGTDRGAATAATRMPVPLTTLIGRDALRDDVVQRLRTRRLVTLVGTGGIGKTRSAIAIAEEAARHLGLAVRFAALSGTASARDVEGAMLLALGVDPVDEDVVGAIDERLGGRVVLVVVDSCEHVVDAAGPLVAQVLARCPRLQVLATSRVALGIPGEVVVDVPPLDLPTSGSSPLSSGALQLLVDRASEVTDSAGWDDAQVEAAVGICRILDGIPLALELAAHQLRYAPVEAVRRELERGLMDDESPLQPFSLAVQRSDALLPDEARAALRRLSLLSGPVPLDVAASIAGGRRVVQALVDSSLLVALGGAVRMYEPVRQYAAHLLTDPERERALALVAEAITDLAERAAPQLVGPDEVMWIAVMGRAHDDVRNILSWADRHAEHSVLTRLAAAVGYLWMLGWGVREGRQWLRRAVGSPAPQPVKARLLVWSAMTALLSGDLDAARSEADEAVSRARAIADDALLGPGLHAAALARMRADTGRARQLLDEAVVVRRRAGDAAGAAMSLGALADLAVREGGFEQAAELYAIGLPLMRASQSERGLLAYLHSMSELEVLRGDPERAEALVSEARPLAVRTGDLWHIGLLAVVAATAARDRGAPTPELRERGRAALAACLDQTDPVVILDGIDVVAGILLDTGDAAAATRLLRASRALRDERRLPIAAQRRRRRDDDEVAASRASGLPTVDAPHDIEWMAAAAADALR